MFLQNKRSGLIEPLLRHSILHQHNHSQFGLYPIDKYLLSKEFEWIDRFDRHSNLHMRRYKRSMLTLLVD